MKKILALLIAAVLCFSLIACSGGDAESKDEKKETKTEEKADDNKTTEADEPEADEPEADEPEADEPEADEPEADEPEADEGIIGEWVAYVDTADSLATLGMDSAGFEEQYGIANVEEILDGVSLSFYMTITEDSIERALYADDVLDFMTGIYDALFGYMADYDVATEISGEDAETLDAQAQAEGYENWPDMCNGMTDKIIAQFEESGTIEDSVTEDSYEFDGEEIVCGDATFTFDGEFIVAEAKGITLTFERV